MNGHIELQVVSEVDWGNDKEAIMANSSSFDDFAEQQELSSGQEKKIAEHTSFLSLTLDENYLNVQNIELNENLEVEENNKVQITRLSDLFENIDTYISELSEEERSEFLKKLHSKLVRQFPEWDMTGTENQIESGAEANQKTEEVTNTQPTSSTVPDNANAAIIANISIVVNSVIRIGANGAKLVADFFEEVVSKHSEKDLTDKESLDKNNNQVMSGINNISSTATDSSIPSNILYRLEVLKQNEKLYKDNLQALWQEPELSKVKKRIQDFAHEQNSSFQDVVQKINEDPELSEITYEFNEAVLASPDAQEKIDVMDNAFSSWMKSHSALTNDFCYLNPENKEMGKAFREYEQSYDNMKEATQEMPKQEGKDKSHFLKLMEYMEKIKENIKKFVNSVKNFFSKTFGQNAQENETNYPSI